MRRILNIWFLFQKIFNTLVGHISPLCDIKEEANSHQGPNQHVQIGNEGYQISDCYLTSLNHKGPDKEGQNIRWANKE